MGFKDVLSSFFKKPGKEEPPIPENPPKEVQDTFSKQEMNPPPRFEDFNSEIPELPDLDIPEELGGVEKFIPDTSKYSPHPNIGVTPPPPPKGKGEASSLPELPPFELEDKEEEEKITPMRLQHPLRTEIEAPKKFHERRLPMEKTTYIKKDYEFVVEGEFSKIYSGLIDISSQVDKSARYANLMKYHNKKEKNIRQFKELMQAIYQELDEVQSLVFERGDE